VAEKKPRVRKVETVREKTAKSTAKAEAKASKQPKRLLRNVAGKVSKPLVKPANLITKPFKTRPLRAIGGFIGLLFWPRYFRNSYKEVKQVTWPTRRETWKLTFAVLVFATIFSLAAAGTDYVLDIIIRRIVFRA